MVSLKSKEQGLIMVMFAILIMAIIAGVALGIDVYVASTSKIQHHHSTEQAALAAMEAYISSSGVAANVALANAKDRVKSMIASNKELWLGSRFLADTNLEQGEVSLDSSNPGANGYLEGGRWHFKDPEDCATRTPSVLSPKCPCDAGTFKKSCFEKLPNNEKANALRLTLHLNDSSPIKTFFAHMIGTDSITIQSRAIVAEVPRHGAFLVDISGSSTSDSHSWGYTVSGFNTPFVYAVSPTALCNSHAGDVSAFTLANGDISTDPLSYIGWEAAESAGTIGTPNAQCTGSDPCHMREDYECYKGTTFTNGTHIPDYIVDKTGTTTALDFKKEPQPLTDIINAVHTALDRFEKRAVGGDRVGVIAFDNEVLATRTTNDCYTNSSDLNAASCPPALVSPDSINDNGFIRWERATRVKDFVNAQGVAKTALSLKDRMDNNTGTHFDLMLFPRPLTQETYKRGQFIDVGANALYDGEAVINQTAHSDDAPATDIYTALIEAVNMLGSDPAHESAMNFIVLFSDGKANCVKSGEEEWWADGPSAPPYYLASQKRCRDIQSYYNTAISNIKNDIIDSTDGLANNNVAFHMVLIGESVSPHTLLLDGGGTNGCLSDSQARERGFNFANWGGTTISDSTFYGPNELWNFTKNTHGLWIPIRKSCNVEGTAEIDLDAICDSVAMAEGTPIKPSDIAGDGGFDNLATALDAQGRLLCDPSNRSKKEQLEDAIDEIMDVTPFILVAELP